MKRVVVIAVLVGLLFVFGGHYLRRGAVCAGEASRVVQRNTYRGAGNIETYYPHAECMSRWP